MRDQLISELAVISSSDNAAIWAHRIIGAKNTLTAADARQVEDDFQARLTELECAADGGNALPTSTATELEPSATSSGLRPSNLGQRPRKSVRTSIPGSIDKSRLIYSEPRRVRDRDHVKFVAKRPCLICGAPRTSSDAAFSPELFRCSVMTLPTTTICSRKNSSC